MNNLLHTFQSLIRPSSRNSDNCATISSDVWVLGRQYPEKNDAFLSDVFAKSFFSYRYDFLPITNLHNDDDGTRVSSDAGWGCMHRSGQMLIAQALTYSALGRDFKIFTDQPFSTSHERETYLKILKNFMDIPNAPFGIQRLTLEGLSFDKYIGEWFGPLAICNAIQAIWGTLNFSRDIGLIISSDGSIPSSALKGHESCLLLIATRLGVEFINSTYYETIKAALQKPYCTGIAGGKNNASFYCIGYQGNSLICLDPHVVQPAFLDINDFYTCHTISSFDAALKDTDPSLLIGFFLNSVQDIEDFQGFVESIPSSSRIFHINENESLLSSDQLNSLALEEF